MKTIRKYFIIACVLLLSSCDYPLTEGSVSEKIIGTWDLIAAELHPENRTRYREYWIITESNLMYYDYDCENCTPDLFGPFDWEYRKPNVYTKRSNPSSSNSSNDYVSAFEIVSLDDEFLVILDNGWWYPFNPEYRTKMTFMKRKGDTNNSVWVH